MIPVSDIAPTDALSKDETVDIDLARQAAFELLMNASDDDEVQANDLFTRMIADAFADQLVGNEEGAVAVVAMTNAKLERCFAGWTIIRQEPREPAP